MQVLQVELSGVVLGGFPILSVVQICVFVMFVMFQHKRNDLTDSNTKETLNKKNACTYCWMLTLSISEAQTGKKEGRKHWSQRHANTHHPAAIRGGL